MSGKGFGSFEESMDGMLHQGGYGDDILDGVAGYGSLSSSFGIVTGIGLGNGIFAPVFDESLSTFFLPLLAIVATIMPPKRGLKVSMKLSQFEFQIYVLYNIRFLTALFALQLSWQSQCYAHCYKENQNTHSGLK